MAEFKKNVDTKRVDTNEFELPDTLFVRDIDNRVFQGIVLQCLSKVEGISLAGGNFIDNILGIGAHESLKAITATQDQKSQSVSIKIEVNITYGISIPDKADEIQSLIAEEITRLTGLHVASVHVVFKDMISENEITPLPSREELPKKSSSTVLEHDYTDAF